MLSAAAQGMIANGLPSKATRAAPLSATAAFIFEVMLETRR
jgi:hypothetical protein